MASASSVVLHPMAAITVPSSRRILSLDGGGVKGMAILLILQRLFRTIQHFEGLCEMPRPCDYFDLIGGTSTGGLIAILLGRLRMSIDECIEVFRDISQTVFRKPPSSVGRLIRAGRGKAFFDAAALETAFKAVLTTRGLGEDDLFCEENRDTNCKVFVCATRPQTTHAVLLRSYKTWQASEADYNCFIWEAARATSAAPLFFDPVKLKASNVTLVDGGLNFNNPITEVIREAESIWPNEAHKSIVSIGTGLIDIHGLEVSKQKFHDVIKTCIGLALNANREAEGFTRSPKGNDLAKSGVYHRFDVDRRIDAVALDEWGKLDDIDAFTDAYLNRQNVSDEVESCARSLQIHETTLNSQPTKGGRYLSTLPKYSDTSSSNLRFSGREAELRSIEETFEAPSQERKSVCLYGLSAIGKSQIAYEYARRHGNRFSVFWVKANTFENVAAGYLAIARKLESQFEHSNQNQIFEYVHKRLIGIDTGPWILVLDNADDWDLLMGEPGASTGTSFKLINYIPFAPHGRILITTQQSRLVGAECDIVPATNGLRVQEMSLDDGFKLVKKCLPSELISKASNERCRYFLKMLGGLPLAIVQATSFMREQQILIEDFISLYEHTEEHSEIFKCAVSTVDKEQKSVLLTWEISYQKIAGPGYSESTGTKSQPAMLLDILGFIDSESSPCTRSLSEVDFAFKDEPGPTIVDAVELFYKEERQIAQASPCSLLRDIYHKHINPSHDSILALGPLRNYSLITSRECWVHPVVYSWISRRLPMEERYKYLNWLVEELLDRFAMIEQGSDDGWEGFIPGLISGAFRSAELMPLRHALKVNGHTFSNRMREYSRKSHLSVVKFAELLYQVGRILFSMRRMDKAIKYIQDAVSTLQQVSGYDQSLLSEKRLMLAKARRNTISNLEALEEARNCFNSFEPPSLQSTLWLADCLWKVGSIQESLGRYRSVMDAFSLQDNPDLRGDKEKFSAAVGAAYGLANLDTNESKNEARALLDNLIIPFLRTMEIGHPLIRLVLPDILMSRYKVASDSHDQATAIHDMISNDLANSFDGSALPLPTSWTGGRPRIWRERVDSLRMERKWILIVPLVEAYINHQTNLRFIVDRMHNAAKVSQVADSKRLDVLRCEVEDWSVIYNHLGRAYFECGKIKKSEDACWVALGLRLMLYCYFPYQGPSASFDSNVYHLFVALISQESTEASAKLSRLDRYFGQCIERYLNMRERSMSRRAAAEFM